MLMTPVTRLRKDAPGSLTAADVAAFMTKHGYPITANAIGNFERAEVLKPPARFVQLYAACTGRATDEVVGAHAATLRMRKRKTGPFRR